MTAANGERPPVLDPAEAPLPVLDAVVELLGRYVVFPSPAALDATALWAVHAHCIDAAETSPRLSLRSPEPRCGKSTVLDLLEQLCPRSLASVSCSVAVLFRSVDADRPTVLFDEVDALFGPRASEHEDLRALINAGHRRGARVQRMVGLGASLAVKSFDVFAPMVLAGIGNLPQTVEDRSIVIRMRRRSRGEHVERFRRREVTPRAAAVRERLECWAAENYDALVAARPDLPDALDDRAADGWEPLLAIAEVVGGAWPERARVAALELSTGVDVEDSTIGVRMLADCRTVFGQDDRISSAGLASRLAALEEAPWSEWKKGPPRAPIDSRGVAKLLRPYGVVPDTVRIGDKTPRGYLRAQFADAWARYVNDVADAPPECSGGPIPPFQVQQPQQCRSEPLSEPKQPPGRNRDVAVEKPPLTCDVALVAVSDSQQRRDDASEARPAAAPAGDQETPVCRTTGEALVTIMAAFPGTTDLPGGVWDLPLDTVASCRVCHRTTVTADDAGPIHHRCRS